MPAPRAGVKIIRDDGSKERGIATGSYLPAVVVLLLLI